MIKVDKKIKYKRYKIKEEGIKFRFDKLLLILICLGMGTFFMSVFIDKGLNPQNNLFENIMGSMALFIILGLLFQAMILLLREINEPLPERIIKLRELK